MSNAIIKSAIIEIERGVLTAWLHLSFGGSGQGFGGHALYLPQDFKHHPGQANYAGHFIFRVLQIAGVERWDQLPGKAIRVDGDNSGIRGIGHVIKDEWFYPQSEFKALKADAKADGEVAI